MSNILFFIAYLTHLPFGMWACSKYEGFESDILFLLFSINVTLIFIFIRMVRDEI